MSLTSPVGASLPTLLDRLSEEQRSNIRRCVELHRPISRHRTQICFLGDYISSFRRTVQPGEVLGILCRVDVMTAVLTAMEQVLPTTVWSFGKNSPRPARWHPNAQGGYEIPSDRFVWVLWTPFTHYGREYLHWESGMPLRVTYTGEPLTYNEGTTMLLEILDPDAIDGGQGCVVSSYGCCDSPNVVTNTALGKPFRVCRNCLKEVL